MTLSRKDCAALAAYRAKHGTSEGFVPVAPVKKRKNEEWQLQYQTFAWWRSEPRPVPHHLFFHVPNGSVLGGTKEQRALKGRMLKLTGMENGVADCFLSVARNGWFGAYMEFKSPAGTLSMEQIQFLSDVEKQGYYTAVIRTFEDAKTTITKYLSVDK